MLGESFACVIPLFQLNHEALHLRLHTSRRSYSLIGNAFGI